MSKKNDDGHVEGTDREKLVADLAEYINQRWDHELTDTAAFYAGGFGDEQAGRELIEMFVEYCRAGKIHPDGSTEALTCWHAMLHMLKRVLAVDMQKATNRKGDLPKAMGLVSRRDAVNRLRDHVIYYAYDHVRYNTGYEGRPADVCCDLVLAAIERTGKLGTIEDAGLTTENIKKIYQRGLDEILGG